MKLRGFIEKVQEHSGMYGLARTEKLIAAVFHLMSARLTVNEERDLVAQFPKELREMWETVREKEVDVVKLSGEDFIEEVRDKAGLESRMDAKRAVKAVFHAIKAQVSKGEAKDVEAQLPSDLKEMWQKA